MRKWICEEQFLEVDGGMMMQEEEDLFGEDGVDGFVIRLMRRGCFRQGLPQLRYIHIVSSGRLGVMVVSDWSSNFERDFSFCSFRVRHF